MFKILSKRRLNPTMTWLVIDAPLVAKKARPGQFIILRTDEYGERIPLTMAGHDAEKGTIDLIYAAVGRTTMLMDQLEEQIRENLYKLQNGKSKTPAKAADKPVSVSADDFSDED